MQKGPREGEQAPRGRMSPCTLLDITTYEITTIVFIQAKTMRKLSKACEVGCWKSPHDLGQLARIGESELRSKTVARLCGLTRQTATKSWNRR